MAAVQTDLPTFSRFAVLEASDEDSEKDENVIRSKETKQLPQKAEKITGARKRPRKKKKKSSSSNAELREMAFCKLPPSRPFLTQPVLAEQINGTDKCQSSQGDMSYQQPQESKKHPQPGNWLEWQEKDEQFVLDQYQKDLEAALRISVMESEKTKKQQRNVSHLSSKVSIKTQPESSKEISTSSDISGEKMSKLDDFKLDYEDTLIRINGETVVGVEGQDGLYWEDEVILENEFQNGKVEEEPVDEDQKIKIKKKSDKDKARKERKRREKEKDKDKKLKEHIDDKVVKMMEASGRDIEEAEVVRNIQLKDEIEKKDLVIEALKEENETLKKDLAQVRKRNKQLCHILGQGEMQDKKDLLIQIQDLQDARDEMSNQVTELVTALEQERSKVSSLKAESLKLQTTGRQRHNSNS